MALTLSGLGFGNWQLSLWLGNCFVAEFCFLWVCDLYGEDGFWGLVISDVGLRIFGSERFIW